MSEATNADKIEALVGELSSPTRETRQRAREALVNMGQAAVVPLIQALHDEDHHVRWEAAMALEEIGDPVAAAPLVERLEDKVLDVRWRAAEALVKFGRAGLPSLLQGLINRSDSVRLREGAHHVLRALCAGDLKSVIAPVVAALEDIEPAAVAPQAAYTALKLLQAE
jgi:hypothetical protein